MQVLNRREFLRGSVAVGATLAAMRARVAWANAMGLVPGIQLYTVRQAFPKDPAGTLKLLHDFGFREVESFTLLHYTAKEFRQLLDDAGLRAPSAHLNLNLNGAELGRVFETAKTLGAH